VSGLSLAGYNVLISLAMAAIAAWGRALPRWPKIKFWLPDGQITFVCCRGSAMSISRLKNILLFRIFGLSYVRIRPVPPQGAYHDRRERGAGCGGRKECD
jgi:hypothetical protein